MVICNFYSGDYGIHVKYNDEHVPNSPAFVHVAPESKDAKLVTLHGLRDRGLDVRCFYSLQYHSANRQ